ncbi:MFS transporter [Phytoactinopolyspora halotolerans]|uniref:MFS transporter n=1 Tax=Phytoactinopolyspora halotolerans TaxID=1981512 RepID=A0A6L9S4E8_9ACTN|nr:MFS transporter [Phytoactinopolyspora halotolerans]NED99650.1 MFS transporter [Phytoactinopolyspora halotolerans]
MLARISRGRGVSAARLARRLYLYAFLEEFILLYPLYAVLFAESGLSTAQISSLFVIWSAANILLEVPSGVLADAVSRRTLLTIGPLLAGTGYALWVLAPSYPAFAVGFVLWGAHSALRSGAFEALVYTELERLESADRYARVIGRTQTASTVAAAVAMASAGPVFAVGGYPAVGAASVAACLACAMVATRLPEHRDRDPVQSTGPGFAQVFRAGMVEVRTRRSVRVAIVFLVAVAAVWGALDEFLALLAVDAGVSTASVPLLLLLVYAGVAAGGLLGEVAGRLPRPLIAGTLTLAAATLAAGGVLAGRALAGSVPAGGASADGVSAAAGTTVATAALVGFALIGAAFCVFQMVQIAADARLQRTISGAARSTVTSVAGLGTEVATIGVFVVYGAASTVASHGTLFAGWAAVYGLIALLLVRARRGHGRPSTSPPTPDGRHA